MRIIGVALVLTVIAGSSLLAQTWTPPRPYDFEIEPVTSINSGENDYAPTLSPDSSQLWFASYRRDDSFGNTDIYRADARGDNRWGAGIHRGEVWNSEENEGAIAFFDGGRKCVVAMDERDGFGDTDLWIATLDEQGHPIEITNMGGQINSLWWETQPTVSPDGSVIYFASDRPGGQGGFDIWVTRFIGEEWTPAVPLDSTINTPGNETAPFLAENGSVLYFSSDRPGGFGREDFWMTMMSVEGWMEPINLGPGVNSSFRELFFHAPAEYDWYFFASDRSGSAGGLDIFSGTPNVFGKGFSALEFSITDTILDRPAVAYVTVTDVTEDRIVWEFPTDAFAEKPYAAWLPAEREYLVTVRQTGEVPIRIEVPPITATEVHRIDLYVGKPPPPDPEPKEDIEIILFDLGEYNVPFFVTGYWRPNVPGELENLFDLLSGSLAPATYIERFPRRSARYREYIDYSRTVDSIFSAMADRIVDEIAPNFLELTEPDEVMGIIVTGFVDPQTFSGVYSEPIDVTFRDPERREHTVREGDIIENFELSGLRSVYARDVVDRMLRRQSAAGNGAFLELMNAGRIEYETIAGGVSGGDEEYDRQRRIHVLIVRR